MSQYTHFFRIILFNVFVSNITNLFVWFAITFWVYLETRSVFATSCIAGVYTLLNLASAMKIGNFVDHHSKKTSLLVSSIISFTAYLLSSALVLLVPYSYFTRVDSGILWVVIILTMIGGLAGGLRSIALSTLVPYLFSQDQRDKANGLVGMVNGVGFLITSVLSGLAIGFVGIRYSLLLASGITFLVFIHIFMVQFPTAVDTHANDTKNFQPTSFRVVWQWIASIPGFSGLIFFASLNNFLGGVFMSLLDAYGLSLVNVQTWGVLLAITSIAFMVGGAFVARFGLGKNPIKALFTLNLYSWIVSIFFTWQSSILFLVIGMALWMLLSPAIEASEQTIIQLVVPKERQGRVIGFAQTIESAASPITTFLIGPIAQFVTIPFMMSSEGEKVVGWAIGTGNNRGIALIFILAGILGFIVTLLMMKSQSACKLTQYYRVLSKKSIQKIN